MFIMMKKVVGQFISIKINLEIFKTALMGCLFYCEITRFLLSHPMQINVEGWVLFVFWGIQYMLLKKSIVYVIISC